MGHKGPGRSLSRTGVLKPSEREKPAMDHIVEVRHIGTDLAPALKVLQDWIERKCQCPAEFEHSTGGPGITFRVRFIDKRDAEAFANTFHGWLNEGSDPNGVSRWTYPDTAAERGSRVKM